MTNQPDTVAIRAKMDALKGFTEGPWEAFIDDSGGQWSSWPLSINAPEQVDKTIIRPGGHWPYEWDAETSQNEACRNAYLIAAAPTMHATILALCDALDAERAEVERLEYVLGGVANAIDTGRNEPLQIWRDQIRIALAQKEASDGKASP